MEYVKGRGGLQACLWYKTSKQGPKVAYVWIEYMGQGKVQGVLVFGRRIISRLACAEKQRSKC